MTDRKISLNNDNSKGTDTEPFIQKAKKKENGIHKVVDQELPEKKKIDSDTKYEADFHNKKEIEEETKVYRIIMLEKSPFKQFVLVPILSILSCFTLLLLAYWSLNIWCAFFYKRTTDLSRATHLLITGTRKEQEIIELVRRKKKLQGKSHRSLKEIDIYKSSVLTTPKFDDLAFEFRHSKYFYDDTESAFMPVELNYYKTYECLHQMYSKGVNEVFEYDQLVTEYGKCNIELPEKTVIQLLFEEVLSPFYVFQIVSIVIWFLDDYWQYSVVIIVMYVISIAVEIIDIKRNIRNLREMVDYECQITVKRIDCEGKVVYRNVPSNDLVPGDIIIVPDNMKMPCDAIQLTGSSIMNEAMLTGESISQNPMKITEQRLELLENSEQMEIDENMNDLDLLPTGLSKESNDNQNYKELLSCLSIGALNNLEIKRNLEKYLGCDRDFEEDNKSIDFDLDMPSYFNKYLGSEVVSGVLTKHRSTQSLSQSLKIDPGTLRYILSLWKRKYKKRWLLQSKANKGRRPHFGIDHLNCIEKFLNSHRF